MNMMRLGGISHRYAQVPGGVLWGLEGVSLLGVAVLFALTGPSMGPKGGERLIPKTS